MVCRSSIHNLGWSKAKSKGATEDRSFVHGNVMRGLVRGLDMRSDVICETRRVYGVTRDGLSCSVSWQQGNYQQQGQVGGSDTNNCLGCHLCSCSKSDLQRDHRRQRYFLAA